jgi:hypothetical protein
MQRSLTCSDHSGAIRASPHCAHEVVGLDGAMVSDSSMWMSSLAFLGSSYEMVVKIL